MKDTLSQFFLCLVQILETISRIAAKRWILFSGVVLVLSACSSDKSRIESVLEGHPDIVAHLIEKNPEMFVSAFQRAAQASQQTAAERQLKEEKEQLENEFKNPLQPVLKNDRAYWGPETAPLTIVEYTDFQCPFCIRAYATLEQIKKTYPGKIRLLYKNLPLSIHPMALPAAKRFEAIALQDSKKAYAYYDDVFRHSDQLNRDGEKFLDLAVKRSGADVAKVKRDMDSVAVRDRIQADQSEAEKFSITGTPGFIIAGVSVRGAYPFETFKTIIDRKLNELK